MSADAMNELREALLSHHRQQHPADSMAYAANAISTLMAERTRMKAEIASLCNKLAAERAAGVEAMREAAINMVAGWPNYVGYTGDIRASVEARIVDRDADIISAIRRLRA